MTAPLEFPVLEPRHVAGATLFANRHDLLAACRHARGGVVVEVGVAHGEFSQFILETLEPARFHAIDTFEMHKYPEHWGIPSEVMFKGMTHLDFFRDRFAARGAQVVTHHGFSHEVLPLLDDASCDLIYIDAGHLYDDVRRDADLARRKLKPGGTIIFNDYTLFDPFLGVGYGVVPAVNELVVNDGWHVTGFAFQKHMFCDIAIRKGPAPARPRWRRWFGAR